MSGPDTSREQQTATLERPSTRTSRRWRVLLHNDDYTTMDFVVYVLMAHFHKTQSQATHIMLQVHHKGVGVAGVYPRDEAETKVARVQAEARESGMPLMLSVEPE
ncbi:MAG: ATP-dependent Clp protease adaptor ClpS [Anaerolineae bacterium]|jgi:ATP-dependent Clp protease adaptor protein ClpS